MKYRKEIFANFIRSILKGEVWHTNKEVDIKKFRIVRYITTEEVHSLICIVWSTATLNQVKEALEVLESEKILRNSGNRWKVLLERYFPPNEQNSRYSFKLSRQKVKAGVCPSCGVTVGYKNRHARSGTAHTGEDCALNKIRNVMEV